MKPTGFAAAALRVTVLNGLSNVLLLLGNTYAARCLGAANVGVAAQVQVSVQQLSLIFNGGLDTTGVRAVASGEEPAADAARAVLAFRLAVAVPLALLWVAWFLTTQPDGAVRTAWLLGAPMLLLASVQLPFLYQATDRMVWWAGFTALSSALAAACYAVFFRPGMPVGSDLWVLVAVGCVVSALTVVQAVRFSGLGFGDIARDWPHTLTLVMRLLQKSWRYWVLALLVFIYTAFPVLLLARLQGDAAAGVLRVCLQLAAALEMVFASINSLLLPRLVRWHLEGDEALWARQRRQVGPHVLVGAGVLLVAWAAAPFVFRDLLGAQFGEGLVPFLVLAAARVVVFIGQIYAWGIVAMRLDRALLGATLCGVAVSLGVNLALIPRYSLLGASIAALAAEVVIVSLCFALQRRHLGRSRAAAEAARGT